MRVEDVYRSHSSKPLSREEEIQLWSETVKGNTASRDTLLKSYYPYIVSQAVRYSKGGIPVEDLIQEGMIGFLHGIPKFDPSTGNRLMTYCAFWVDAYIRRYIDSHCTTVRIPAGARRKGIGAFADLSLNSPVGDGMDDFQDILEDDSIDASEQMGTMEDIHLVKKAVKKTVFRSKIRKVAHDVVSMRILADEPCRLQEIADIHGLSRERIRQVEVEARAALKRTILRLAA